MSLPDAFYDRQQRTSDGVACSLLGDASEIGCAICKLWRYGGPVRSPSDPLARRPSRAATLSRGDALTQRELARRMFSDPSTVRAMLVLLEKQGLVERDTHPSDSRARTVALTAAGKRNYRQLWNAGESIRTTMFDSIQPEDAAIFVRLLTQIAESLNGESLYGSNPTQTQEV